jgi:predicted alpha/beta superfamily hydrolase
MTISVLPRAFVQGRPTMNKQQVALTAYVLSPIILFAALCWMIAISIKEPRRFDVPAVGAGAGSTGGANAIGELLAHGQVTSPRATATAPRQGESVQGEGSQAGGSAASVPGESSDDAVEPEALASGVTLIVEDKSGKSSVTSPIYVACNYNNWNPGDAAYKLEPQSDMRWRVTIKRPEGRKDRLEFKFTRGSWELEELNQDMSAPGNRTLPKIDLSEVKAGEAPKFEFVVPHWGDERPEFTAAKANDSYRDLKVTGNVKRLQVRGGVGPNPAMVRDVLVWLPPGYDEVKNSNVTYPVLYLHDGQNVFEQPPGVPGEWGADEIATSLTSRHMVSPAIIVAIPHSGETRNSEYLPMAAIEGITPRGEEHIAWLKAEVMPRVERAFRVKTGPENTAIGGASLGAVISLYAAAKHPDVFGMVLAESLPFREGDSKAWGEFTGSVKSWPRKMYLGMGGAELGPAAENAAKNKAYVDSVRSLEKVLDKAGLGPDRRMVLIDESAEHNEQAWSKRFASAYAFLFPPAMDGTK